MKVLVYGKGQVGQSVKDFLEFFGVKTDIVDDSDFKGFNHDFVVVSPGIKPSHFIYNFPVKGELDVIYEFLNKLDVNYTFYGITGTDGKSSSCWLTYNVLKKYLPTYIGGNFSPAISKVVLETLKLGVKKAYFVVEVSSFMAYNLNKFRFKGSFWTNFDYDHLDWHKDISDYYFSKLKLFKQSEFYYPKVDFDKVSFFKTKHDDLLYFIRKILEFEGINITYEELNSIISLIPKLPHRLNYIGKIKGINVIDDGKCTTANCLGYALSKVGSCLLIAGGYDKGIEYNLDFSNVRFGIFFGQISTKLEKLAIKYNVPYIIENDFEKIVEKAVEIALSKNIDILFSPGASSFDMFNNREERVNKFLDLIKPYFNE